MMPARELSPDPEFRYSVSAFETRKQIRNAALEEAAVAVEYAANSAAAEGDERGVRLFEGAAESIRALKEVTP